jgi:hypothetical protein
MRSHVNDISIITPAVGALYVNYFEGALVIYSEPFRHYPLRIIDFQTNTGKMGPCDLPTFQKRFPFLVINPWALIEQITASKCFAPAPEKKPGAQERIMGVLNDYEKTLYSICRLIEVCKQLRVWLDEKRLYGTVKDISIMETFQTYFTATLALHYFAPGVFEHGDSFEICAGYQIVFRKAPRMEQLLRRG